MKLTIPPVIQERLTSLFEMHDQQQLAEGELFTKWRNEHVQLPNSLESQTCLSSLFVNWDNPVDKFHQVTQIKI